MPEEPRCADSLTRPLADPDPLSLALAIIGALASVGALAAEIRGQVRDDRARKHEKERILRNAVGDTQRLVYTCRANLEDLANILDQHHHTRSRFAVGAAPLVGGPSTIDEIRALHDRILGNARRMRDGFIRVSELLDDQDYLTVQSYIREIDDCIRRSLQPEYYDGFIRRASQAIGVVERLLDNLTAENDIARYPSDW